MSILEEVKKGAVAAVYAYGASSVSDSVHGQLVNLTGPGKDENGQLREKNAVNRVIDTDVGRAGVSYALGMGARNLPEPLQGNSVVVRLAQTMRVNAFATVIAATVKSIFRRK